MYNLSDENVCKDGLKILIINFFVEKNIFLHTLPIDRSSMTHFRHRVGEGFCIALLQESLNTAHKLGAVETKNLERIVVDTLSMPKATSLRKNYIFAPFVQRMTRKAQG